MQNVGLGGARGPVRVGGAEPGMKEPETPVERSGAVTPAALREPAYWGRVAREAQQYQWRKASAAGPLLCMPVIAAWYFFGVHARHEQWAVFAVAGAVTASFGAFQRLGDGHLLPMAVLLVGNAAATWLGNVSGYAGWYVWALLSTVCGFAFGVMTALGYGGW